MIKWSETMTLQSIQFQKTTSQLHPCSTLVRHCHWCWK